MGKLKPSVVTLLLYVYRMSSEVSLSIRQFGLRASAYNCSEIAFLPFCLHSESIDGIKQVGTSSLPLLL